jgi:HEAT repeat protein
MAAWALGKIGEDKAISALEQALGDQNEGVVEYAKEAIQRLNYN